MKRIFPPSVVIVGASLGGCMAALELARAGVPSLLLDKATFPRRKACGEGLSTRGQAELQNAGFSIAEHCPQHLPLYGYRITHGARSCDLPQERPLVGIQRAELDSRLLEFVAGQPLVSVRTGVALGSVSVHKGRFTIGIGRDSMTVPHLVVADGASSSTMRKLGCQSQAILQRRLGSSSAWRLSSGSLAPLVHTFVLPGGELYLTPTGRETVNVSALGSAEFVRKYSSPSFLDEWLRERRELLGATCIQESPVIGAGPLNSHRRAATASGAFVVGDACETFDPIGGMGMTHALTTGRLAAQEIVRALASGEMRDACSAYARRQERVAREMRGFTRMTSWLLGSSVGRAALPIAIRSGVAGRVSQAVHSVEQPTRWNTLLEAVGR